MANVSLEAIQGVKAAMTTYESECRQVLHSLRQQANASLNQCTESVRSLSQQVAGLQSLVNQQKREVCLLQQRLDALSIDIRRISEELPLVRQQLDDTGRRIDQLNEYLKNLGDRLSGIEDEDEKQRLQAQIAHTEKEFQSAAKQRLSLELRQDELRRMLSSKQAQRTETKSRLERLEEELQKNEQMLGRLCDKCERLKTAHASVASAVGLLVSSTQKLQRDDTINSSISCLDGCIACLDEYLSINF